MTLHFTCTCGRKLKALASMAGKTSYCPQCGETLTVPGPPAPQCEGSPDTPAAVSKASTVDKGQASAPTAKTAPRKRPPRTVPAKTYVAGRSQSASVFVRHHSRDEEAGKVPRLSRHWFDAWCDLLVGLPFLFRVSAGLAILTAFAIPLYRGLFHAHGLWVNGILLAPVHAAAVCLLLGYGCRFLDSLLDYVMSGGQRTITVADWEPAPAFGSLLRWALSFVCGPAFFAYIAFRQWMTGGDPGLLDTLILLELGTAAATWWITALVVLARRLNLVVVSPVRLLNAAWRLGPRLLFAGAALAVVSGVHLWLVLTALTLLHTGLFGLFLLWACWFSIWCSGAFALRIVGAWYYRALQTAAEPTANPARNASTLERATA